MPKPLAPEQIQKQLAGLEFNWKFEGSQLRLEVDTKNFTNAAWAIGEIAKAAEELNHHPDLSIRNYKQLTIELSTHSEGGVTAKDFELAEKIDAIITRVE